MGIQTIGYDVKDPRAFVDYSIDWTDYLALVPGDAIATSTWEKTPSDNPVVLSSITGHDGTFATVWTAGGTLTQNVILTNRITTVGGRSDERSILLYVRDL